MLSTAVFCIPLVPDVELSEGVVAAQGVDHHVDVVLQPRVSQRQALNHLVIDELTEWWLTLYRSDIYRLREKHSLNELELVTD